MVAFENRKVVYRCGRKTRLEAILDETKKEKRKEKKFGSVAEMSVVILSSSQYYPHKLSLIYFT